MGMGIERGTFDGLQDERRKGERGEALFEVDSLRPSRMILPCLTHYSRF